MTSLASSDSTLPFRLPGHSSDYRARTGIAIAISDVARGVEAGDGGLKSAAGVAVGSMANNAKRRENGAEVPEEKPSPAYVYAPGGGVDGAILFNNAHQISDESPVAHMFALETWIDRIGLTPVTLTSEEDIIRSATWTAAGYHLRRRRCERTFRTMRASDEGTKHAAVLHIVYGYFDPFLNTTTPRFVEDMGPDLAPLARYTDTVEVRRQAMAQDAARSAMDETDGPVDLRAYQARLAYEDRCTSSGDALRAGIATRAKDKAAYDALIVDLRLETNRMLTDASTAFAAAWVDA
jgi:hypothetical protein